MDEKYISVTKFKESLCGRVNDMLDIDTAIKHCLEVAEQEEKNSKTGKWFEGEDWNIKAREQCAECAAEHRQLAEWLTELKDLREENKVLMQECDRLIKEKGELLSKVSGGDVLRICQLEEQLKNCKEEYANLNKISYGYYKELKEAKRLLKFALDDIQTLNDLTVDDENGCLLEDKFESCTECPLYCGSDKYCGWQYQVDALMLIGGEPNE